MMTTNIKINCKYVLFLYCVFSTLRFMYATQSSKSHLFGHHDHISEWLNLYYPSKSYLDQIMLKKHLVVT